MNVKRMKIMDAEWTPRVNMLIIQRFACKNMLKHRSDRWKIKCKCGNSEDLGKLRKEYCYEEEAS